MREGGERGSSGGAARTKEEMEEGMDGWKGCIERMNGGKGWREEMDGGKDGM